MGGVGGTESIISNNDDDFFCDVTNCYRYDIILSVSLFHRTIDSIKKLTDY